MNVVKLGGQIFAERRPPTLRFDDKQNGIISDWQFVFSRLISTDNFTAVGNTHSGQTLLAGVSLPVLIGILKNITGGGLLCF